MDNQLVTVDNSLSPMNRSLPSEHEMMVFSSISKQAAESNMYKNYGGQAGIMMTILAARELGVPPMLALNGGIANIQGRLEISARLMNSMMRRAGIRITIKESTETVCKLIGTRGDSGDSAEVSYTLEEAKTAGLVKVGGGWVKNPKDMCFARAISRLARQIAPDIIGGCYIEGEIRATDSDSPNLKDIPMEIMESNAEDELKRLMSMFDSQDHLLVMNYIKVVMNHFKWSQEECVRRFLEEKSLIEKFSAWKNKRNISDGN